MKRTVSTVLLVVYLLLLFIPVGVSASESTPVVTTYSMPSDLPSKYVSSDFDVSISGAQVPVYCAAVNAWNQPISYASFDFSGTITVSVSVKFPFSTARILPRSANIPCTINSNIITFTLDEPQNVTILIDEDFQGKALHIFAQPLETDIPDESEQGVMYFAPGYHDYSTQGPILVPSNTTVYLAGGAVVCGRFLVKDASNVEIRGKGILLNDYLRNDGYDDVPLVIKRSDEVTVRDIIISRDMNLWSAFMYKCSNVTVENVKIVNPRYACSDGFDIANCHDVTYDNVFIRSCDDSVSIKGTGTSGYDSTENPDAALPNYNITIKNSQVWSDTNNALELGAETVASYYDNIKFSNIDILYNYDDYTYPDYHKERSAINICALNATDFSNIIFENIRVEQAKRLISINMCDDYWFGSIQGNWSWAGNIDGIVYKNITSYSTGSNEIRIHGRDENHKVKNIQFENVVINGTSINSFSDTHFQVNSFVDNLQIKNGTNTLATANGPFGSNAHVAATEYSNVQGNNGWRYRTWTAGVGMFDMTWDAATSWWRGQHAYDSLWMYDGYIYLHPDDDQTMFEWTAPHTGTVNIVGNVRKFDTAGGDGVSVSIWKNNTQVWPSNGVWQHIGYSDNTGYDHNIEVSVTQGDILSFRVAEGDTNAYDTTMWNPEIVYE